MARSKKMSKNSGDLHGAHVGVQRRERRRPHNIARPLRLALTTCLIKVRVGPYVSPTVLGNPPLPSSKDGACVI